MVAQLENSNIMVINNTAHPMIDPSFTERFQASLFTAILKFKDSKVGRSTPNSCNFRSSSETMADGSVNILVVSQDQLKWIVSDGNLMERSEKMM